MEIFITVLIAFLAIFILARSTKKKIKGGGCDCGSCSSHCPVYEEKKSK